MLYFYEDGYYFEMDESRLIGNGQFRKKIQYVKLVPKDSEAEIKYILLGIDTEFNQIYEVIETGKNETVTTISIVDFEFNLPCLLYTSPSPRDLYRSRMPSSA